MKVSYNEIDSILDKPVASEFLEECKLSYCRCKERKNGSNANLEDIVLAEELKPLIGQANLSEEGCHLCNSEDKDYKWYGNCIYNDEDGKNILSLRGYEWDDSEDDFSTTTIDINFCPNCGREL